MIISIDESGDFREGSTSRHFFCGISLRQQSDLYRQKKDQFLDWERSLPKRLKDSKGEFKSSNLSEENLSAFVENVIDIDPIIIITPMQFRPSANPRKVIEKHKNIQLAGINDGILLYTKQKKMKLVKTYKDFSNWYRKLSYPEYVKLLLLGACITKSLSNTFGTAIALGFDSELVDLRIILDEGYVKSREQDIFWHEILRNQLYFFSHQDPLLYPIEWQESGHPFFDKYQKDGHIELNELFQQNCKFGSSRTYFEIRIADTVSTILNRYQNKGVCQGSYEAMKKKFAKDGKITEIILKDIDFENRIGKEVPNPWGNL